jgi:hypothetical protein
VNRAQLKALAARQAMTAAQDARPVAGADVDDAAAGPARYAAALPRGQRRPVLSREQEYAFIRRDLLRLTVISIALLALLFVLLVVLR